MNALWKEIARRESNTTISLENFWSGIQVWIERPHLLNDKLLAAEKQKTWTNLCRDIQFIEFLICGHFSKESINVLLENAVVNINEIDKKGHQSENRVENKNCTLILRNLIPKRTNMFQDILETVLLDKGEMTAAFFPEKHDISKSNIIPPFPYRFKKFDEGIILEVLQNQSEDITTNYCASKKWLENKVLSKILKWCQNIPKQPIMPSLKLVSVKDYHTNLCYLKAKYAKKFIEIWPLYNKTDPEKYVYEDISIAAYLITLWEQDRKKSNLTEKQTFVDLGCGNGFLDHILSSEGHVGIGVDIRKRKIWDVYGAGTRLLEMAIEPSDKQLFPNYDWIIGNHADELTPWIPVIAARSSYKMKVFLLPCCFYTFDGKYSRQHHNLTQYQSYLNFIQNLCFNMGFQVEQDKLRIPSTKRSCFICSSRTYEPNEEAEMDMKRTEFINSHLKKTKESVTSKHFSSHFEEISPSNPCHNPLDTSLNWVSSFAPRDPVELARNCTNLDKRILTNAIMTLFKFLLLTENCITIQRDSDTLLWNKGGKLKIEDLSLLFDSEIVKCLKNQRGGFQTLLRNHSNIFEVKDGVVQIKVPLPMEASSSDAATNDNKLLNRRKGKISYKKKACFFYLRHPQGCPVPSNECCFSHDVQLCELRESI